MAERKNNGNNKTDKKDMSQTFFSKLAGYNYKDGKGVKKKKITDKERYSLKGFFSVYKMQFWNLIILNMVFMLLVSPALCALLSYTGIFGTRVMTPSNILYAPVYGANLCLPSPVTSSLVGIFGAQGVVTAGNSFTVALNYIALAVFLTFGFANAGMTYVLRAYTRGDFVFLWSDFFRTIKKNFFSALALGIADLAVIIMLVLSMLYYYTASLDFSYTVLFFITFSMGVIYFMMRFYLYLLLITFKQSPFKLIKNAFILTLVGIKRNVLAVLGILVLLLLNAVVLMFSVPFGITLPFFFIFAHGGFIACFAAYPNVKKYMIDPYYEENPENGEKFVIEDEPIFIDKG